VIAEVLWVDRFGNAQLNVDPDEVASWGDRIGLRFGDTKRTARRAGSYAALKTGEVGLVVDSLRIGWPSASIAARPPTELGLHAGDPVTSNHSPTKKTNSVRSRLGIVDEKRHHDQRWRCCSR